ncbi:hypothetical protein [Halorussus litoreus]|uniref:hypothetical protein n=1 Tax=Halorussus litoreus TaxID=1710536 RepID=UPI00130063F6|nr:hypothetical protein [Halorussus litoreus]
MTTASPTTVGSWPSAMGESESDDSGSVVPESGVPEPDVPPPDGPSSGPSPEPPVSLSGWTDTDSELDADWPSASWTVAVTVRWSAVGKRFVTSAVPWSAESEWFANSVPSTIQTT